MESIQDKYGSSLIITVILLFLVSLFSGCASLGGHSSRLMIINENKVLRGNMDYSVDKLHYGLNLKKRMKASRYLNNNKRKRKYKNNVSPCNPWDCPTYR